MKLLIQWRLPALLIIHEETWRLTRVARRLLDLSRVVADAQEVSDQAEFIFLEDIRAEGRISNQDVFARRHQNRRRHNLMELLPPTH